MKIVLNVNGFEVAFPIGEGGVIGIGTAAECGIRFADHPLLAPSHAELRTEGGRWLLVDRRTRRGCRLNGRIAEFEELAAGDVITLPAHLEAGIQPLNLRVVSLPYEVRMEVSDRANLTLSQLELCVGALPEVWLSIRGQAPVLAPPIPARTSVLLAALLRTGEGVASNQPWPRLHLADEYRLHGSENDNVRNRHRSALRAWWAEVLAAHPALGEDPEFRMLIPAKATLLRLVIPRIPISILAARDR